METTESHLGVDENCPVVVNDAGPHAPKNGGLPGHGYG